ncbi:TIGR03032 family protein [Nitrosomonas sp. PY1]|uniref:TIGR03032 family protein n=1 Tax=Nitrosomonas sp. PY1 TaxID=1803906 RepID=UPI001FC7DD63|nr:TIGR03032 family protein [Nitrosomonas sp. PY1]GKS70216.1 TIGR03032 family protein [Nitrosomonas sp. PY1]
MSSNDTAQSPAISATIPTPILEINGSRQFLSWLAEQRLSIAFTTYQIGKVYFIGLKPDSTLSVFERSFNRCMGLCTTSNGLYMSALYQVWRFENILQAGQRQDGFDRLYRPQIGYTTGDLDIHDMAVDSNGRLIFVNTLFGCLATLSDTHSFRPIWQPFFLNKLAAEDRCHLNGLAMKDGQPAYVTAISQSNVVDGWRDHRANGGIVMDVARNEIVCSGLSMPHSPRWHQGKLWLLNSGTGDFGYVDLNTGRFESVCFCPGYMRGLSFCGNFALVGLSKSRENRTFSGLALDNNLRLHRIEARCGIQVVDLRTGDIVHWFHMEGVVRELYDVVALPEIRCPMALGFKTDEIRRLLNIEDSLVPSN